MQRSLKPDLAGRRLPPGQHLVADFPVLSYGPTPRFNPQTWDFRVDGEVAAPIRLNYQQFRALPTSRLTADFHCVTTWSRFDNAWEGVRTRDIASLVRLTPEARHAIILCDAGYITNLTVEEFLGDDVLLAWGHDGADLHPAHGYPLRLVVPKLYGWKSAKWVRAIEFSVRDRRGFWEVRGYHNHGDPWAEERYSADEGADD